MNKEFNEWFSDEKKYPEACKFYTSCVENHVLIDWEDITRIQQEAFEAGQRNPTVENIKSAFEKLTQEERSNIMEKYLPTIPLM